MSQYEAQQFPALCTAPAQSAMVQVVEREGHSALISEVLTQESTMEQTLVGVFKAFLRMIELKHATVEEIVTLFHPEDFHPHLWEQATSQVNIVYNTFVSYSPPLSLSFPPFPPHSPSTYLPLSLFISFFLSYYQITIILNLFARYLSHL